MKTIVGVMGAGRQLEEPAREVAYDVGARIARAGWVLLTGGSACGIMDAASQGAHEAGGLVVGILKGEGAEEGSRFLDVAVRTGMGDARNVINVLTSDVVIALPGGHGTISEVALALKSGKTVVLLGWDPGEAMRADTFGRLLSAGSAEEAIDFVKEVLAAGAST